MRPELHHIENIERYLNKEMNAQEKAAFEQELAKNETLNQQFESLQLLQKAVVRRALKNDIQKFAPKKGLSFTKWASIIGAVVVLAGLSFFWMNNNENTSVAKEVTAKSAENINDAEPVDELQENESNASSTDNITTQNQTATFSDISRLAPKNVSRRAKFNGLQTWLEPDVQRFSVNTKTGAALEGKDGTLIVVPKHAFVDNAGNIIQGNVEIELIEALSMEDMIAYNLATTANGKALSSGGMIYVQPYANGEKVNINPKRPLYIEIPTDDYDPEMKSWRGVVDNQGDINWENPQDLQKYLVRVDLNQLDFLPPNFENAVHTGMPFRKHKVADKRLVDSLYYGLNSFKLGQTFRIGDFDCSQNDLEYLFGDIGYIVENNIRDKGINFSEMVSEYQNRKTDLIKKVDSRSELTTYEKKCFCLMLERDQVPEKTLNILGINAQNNIEAKNSTHCYIDPLFIKTIKTEKFANTFIATKEFETRLQALHKIPNADSYLKLYIDNLQKNLWEVDALVAKQLTGEHKTTFENFAAQKCTNLKDAEIHQELLSEYYAQKRKSFEAENQALQEKYNAMGKEAVQKIQQDISNIRVELGKLEKQQFETRNSLSSLAQNSNPVLNSNTTRDFSTPSFSRNVVSANNTYATPWYEPGWMNIDKYLFNITENSVDVQVATNVKSENANNAKVYQCINSLKTLIPLRITNGKAISKFPSKGNKEAKAMESTYAIGLQWSDQGKVLFAEQKFNPYKTQQIELTWTEIDEKELKKRLKSLDYTKNLLSNIAEQEKAMAERAKLNAQIEANKIQMDALNLEINSKKKQLDDLQIQAKKEAAFVEALKKAIDVCKSEFSSIELKNDLPEVEFIAAPIELVEEPATFSGGEVAMMNFIRSNFNFPKDTEVQGISGKIYVEVIVEIDGTLSAIKIRKGLHPKLDEVALRVVSNMPPFTPARDKGLPIRHSMIIPIAIEQK